jgi:hypothetical protein
MSQPSTFNDRWLVAHFSRVPCIASCRCSISLFVCNRKHSIHFGLLLLSTRTPLLLANVSQRKETVKSHRVTKLLASNDKRSCLLKTMAPRPPKVMQVLTITEQFYDAQILSLETARNQGTEVGRWLAEWIQVRETN